MNSNGGINNKKMDDWIEIIYLQLYKDTYLIFMQAYKPLQRILDYSRNSWKKKDLLFKSKSIY